jgi:hypothetical protein
MLNDEPTRENIWPFTATDEKIRTTKTRDMYYLPFERMEPLLGAELTALQVFKLIVQALVDTCLEDTCTNLIYCLSVYLVQPSATLLVPLTLQPQAGKTGYFPDPMAISHCREHVLYSDLPALHPTSLRPTASGPDLINITHDIWYMVADQERREMA